MNKHGSWSGEDLIMQKKEFFSFQDFYVVVIVIVLCLVNQRTGETKFIATTGTSSRRVKKLNVQ
ncbi:MAG: hypothetical protein A2504_12620 [Bdellovibrionales bacterium RIFOXYD12_FULL_39_22]|nr:MAG: hypothetical protein A2385_00040 [Bdellovibrionales bacterium RIFOXYB1_FULL_39_21]OFZ44049.1 MAG: hypothetical protein A2485_03705 [Bdellovibrionales bacterium RIFOXYC12_FULL_39_17]OFZ95015.1 MAG: hypothetical protein A2504_12620 [Bdellovibrionales bacterium RIFOXYD12_FULL_39_22]